MSLRVVFDTNVVLSALIFTTGQLAWLRGHWPSLAVRPLGSKETIAELLRAMRYPKFRLEPEEIEELVADYLPYVEILSPRKPAKPPRCADPDDQKFIDLALAGKADVLVTGDRKLLTMAGSVRFTIETPATYRARLPDLQR